MKIYILLLIVLFSVGCSPQRRLNRLIIKHPELIKTDTLKDSVIVPKIEFDTVFKLQLGETITINKDSIVYQFALDSNNNLQFKNIVPERKFPIVVIKRTFTGEKPQKKQKSKNHYFVFGLLTGLLMSKLIYNIFKK